MILKIKNRINYIGPSFIRLIRFLFEFFSCPNILCRLINSDSCSQVPIIRGVLYIVAQCAGAITGSAILRALSADTMEEFLGVVKLSSGITPVQGFGVEFFLALILVLVVCGACDSAKPESKGIAPIIIGLTVTVSHLIGVNISILKNSPYFFYMKKFQSI